MQHLFHNMLELLTCFFTSLVSVFMFYDMLIMINRIGANHKNTIHFLQVGTKYEQVYAEMGLFSLTQSISFLHSC